MDYQDEFFASSAPLREIRILEKSMLTVVVGAPFHSARNCPDVRLLGDQAES